MSHRALILLFFLCGACAFPGVISAPQTPLQPHSTGPVELGLVSAAQLNVPPPGDIIDEPSPAPSLSPDVFPDSDGLAPSPELSTAPSLTPTEDSSLEPLPPPQQLPTPSPPPPAPSPSFSPSAVPTPAQSPLSSAPVQTPSVLPSPPLLETPSPTPSLPIAGAGANSTSGNSTGSRPSGSNATNTNGNRPPIPILSDPEQQRTTCFPADATVQLAGSAEVVRLATLRVGQSVLSSKSSFSSVFAFTHREPYARAQFVELHTPAGLLTATAPHYVFTIQPGDTAHAPGVERLIEAGKVRVGMVLLRPDGRNGTVVTVRTTTQTGLFNPHTASGTLVVDGFKVSAYTSAVAAPPAHALLLPLRAVFRACRRSWEGVERVRSMRLLQEASQILSRWR